MLLGKEVKVVIIKIEEGMANRDNMSQPPENSKYYIEEKEDIDGENNETDNTNA